MRTILSLSQYDKMSQHATCNALGVIYDGLFTESGPNNDSAFLMLQPTDTYLYIEIIGKY